MSKPWDDMSADDLKELENIYGDDLYKVIESDDDIDQSEPQQGFSTRDEPT